MNEDLSHLSLLEIFRVESETQTAHLTSGLLELEKVTRDEVRVTGKETPVTGPPSPDPSPAAVLESLMRAAHSLKGAARIVGLDPAVRIAHALEDCFVAAQHGTLRLAREDIDLLFRGVDLLQHLGRRSPSELDPWTTAHEPEIHGFLEDTARLLRKTPSREPREAPEALSQQLSALSHEPSKTNAEELKSGNAEMISEFQNFSVSAFHDKSQPLPAFQDDRPSVPDRVLRLTAENLNRLLGLAGESLVESRWLRPFTQNLQRLKHHHADLAALCQQLSALSHEPSKTNAEKLKSGHAEVISEFQNFSVSAFHDKSQPLTALSQQLSAQSQLLSAFLDDRLDELDRFDRRSTQLAHRLYLEALRTRMRPFSDGIRRFPRMVRDLAQALGKDVRLEIIGETTPVDRDLLEKLETPLAHLLRNAVDHGCESPELRRQLGKPPTATLRLEARHSAGLLLLIVSDDGAGVNPNHIRETLVRKRLTLPALAQRLSDAELLEFLFLPGFTLKDRVTEISGRGVGLDVVQNMVKSVRGSIRISSQPGRGTRFLLQLPLTLSVLRTLLVEIGGEPYALPLSQISRTLLLPRARIEALEGRHHFRLDSPNAEKLKSGNAEMISEFQNFRVSGFQEAQGESIGLLAAHQVFGCGAPDASAPCLPVVVLGNPPGRHGLLVDRFLGERELVVQPLDPRLGKVKDISAAALMEDGTPVLIVDVEDLLRSVEKLIADGAVLRVRGGTAGEASPRRKRVLAVDDSLTVRELVRKLLASHGYEADVAVDGMDGWNSVRAGHYDLVITDVDMPRMDGIELTRLIKKDPKLEALPVLIVSYKDRDEDRLRGLEAGADYYLTKSSFHDEKLLQAVADLIGEAEP